jgi:hypothetical protein
MKNLNLYSIKLEWNVDGDEEPSYSDDSVLASNAEEAVAAAKEELLKWEVNEQNTDLKKITYIRLHECKMEYEDISIISRELVRKLNQEFNIVINKEGK